VLPNQSQNTQQNRPQQQPQVISGTINLNQLGGGLSSLLQGFSGQPINLQQSSQQQSQQQPSMMGGFNIGGLMSMLGGMGMNLPQQAQQNQPSQSAQQQQSTAQQQPQQVPHVHGPGCNHHQQQPQQQPPQQQAPQQFPQLDMSNLASMASMLFNPQQQTQQSSTQPQSQQQQQNPMGGLMGIFSSLQQSGGMGELLNTSLGETLEEGLSSPTVYSTILKSFTGSDILTCFTSKNFEFLDRKYDLVRSNFLNAISIAGSQEELV
jgi:hypothetical protein